MKRIMDLNAFLSGRILGASQSGSRENISLLACICADNTALTPAIIYQADSQDLQDTWLAEFDHTSERAAFAASRKGWTSNQLGLAWLHNVFEPETRSKAGGRHRLLIADGHSSHLNLQFIEACDRLGIILVILPAHSTHRLQPLDVGIFGPLASAYSREHNNWFSKNEGFTHFGKRHFWPLFRNAWSSAVTSSNISSAFRATGIFPYNPEYILSPLRETSKSKSKEDDLPKDLPLSDVRAIRRFEKELANRNVEPGDVPRILTSLGQLAIRSEILTHRVDNLQKALLDEKKRRKRGKPMGLFDKNRPGEGQFWTPSHIGQVRNRNNELEEAKMLEEVRKTTEKAHKALDKANKEREKQQAREKRLADQEARRVAAQAEKERRANEKARKQAEREQLQVEKRQTQLARQRTKAKQPVVVVSEPEVSKTTQSRSGRQTALPSRFR